ncbi:MAG: sigma-70 family RNA polymerase sigma factor [Planctomycetota bacterium]
MDRCPLPEPAFASDEELVARLHAGDHDQALTELEQRYGKRIWSFVVGMVRDGHLAHDVTQEVFEKVLCKHDQYRPGTNFRAWLFEIARNQALSALRAQKRLPRPVSSLQGDDEPDLLQALPAGADHDLEEAEFMTAFRHAVASLPERYRDVFEACVQRGKPYQEAGAELGLPTGTVAIRIMRARKRLFSALQHHLGRLRRPPACFQ